MMKFIFKMLFLLLFLVSCGGKKVSTEKQKTTEKERKELRKDSVFQKKVETKTASFSFEKNKIFELELQSDKDSLGNSKEFSIEKIRSPTSEKIIVRGGSLKLKTTQHSADKITKKDTLRVNNTSVHTNIEEVSSTDKQIFKKEEDKKNTGFSFGFYFWLILILILLFLAWRLKLFKL